MYRSSGDIVRATYVAALAAALAACTAGGPTVVPLTKSRLSEAEARWLEAGADSYHLVVRLEVAKVDPVVYDVVVRKGAPAKVTRNGKDAQGAQALDCTVPGLFRLLESELQIVESDGKGLPNLKVELFARFDPATGRLERYQRKTSRRATGLRIEVLEFEMGPAG